MAKKRSAKPNKPAQQKTAAKTGLPENTIELHLPPTLYQTASKLDPEVLKQLLRAIFDHDNLFGITQVQIRQGSLRSSTQGNGDPKKVCDGP